MIADHKLSSVILNHAFYNFFLTNLLSVRLIFKRKMSPFPLSIYTGYNRFSSSLAPPPALETISTGRPKSKDTAISPKATSKVEREDDSEKLVGCSPSPCTCMALCGLEMS